MSGLRGLRFGVWDLAGGYARDHGFRVSGLGFRL